MLRQAKNIVRIEGILSEIDLEEKDYLSGGRDVHAISGTIKVKLKQKIHTHDANEVDVEVPVSLFANELKKDGNPNPAFESIKNIKDSYVSLAAVDGDISKADCVRITSGQVQMNEYYSQSGQLVSFPRISTTFVNKIDRTKMNMHANFELEGVVDTVDYEILPSGDQGRFAVTLIVPGYNDRVDVIKIYVLNQSAIDFVSQNWQHGQTVPANGALNFSARTETTLKEQGFGDPIEQHRTIKVSELILNGGDYPYDEALEYNRQEIGMALAKRKERLDESRVKTQQKSTAKPATPSKTATDYGF